MNVSSLSGQNVRWSAKPAPAYDRLLGAPSKSVRFGAKQPPKLSLTSRFRKAAGTLMIGLTAMFGIVTVQSKIEAKPNAPATKPINGQFTICTAEFAFFDENKLLNTSKKDHNPIDENPQLIQKQSDPNK